MRIIIHGTRGPKPVSGESFLKYGGDTTCVSAFSDQGKHFILDAGTGIRLLNQTPEEELYLLFSHPHSHHILELPFFKPTHQPSRSIRVFGGNVNEEGTRRALENLYHRSNFPVPLPFDKQKGIKEIIDFIAGEKIYDDGQIKVETFWQPHPYKGSIAYRFTERKSGEKDKKFVFATDFEPDVERSCLYGILEFWAGADLVIADCQYEPRGSESKTNSFMVGYGHSDYKTNLEIATLGGIKKMVGTHHNPASTDDYLSGLELRARSEAEKIACRLGRERVETELAKPGSNYIL